MSENIQQSGFREVPHTADRAVMVWAPTLDELFLQAAYGMYQVIGIKSLSLKQYYRNISLFAADQEGLLVSFLSELLYFLEKDQLVFQEFQLSREDESLRIEMSGKKVSSAYSEIKAVTYNELEIRYSKGLYRATIVFDI